MTTHCVCRDEAVSSEFLLSRPLSDLDDLSG
jgi:hypothetical protein